MVLLLLRGRRRRSVRRHRRTAAQRLNRAFVLQQLHGLCLRHFAFARRDELRVDAFDERRHFRAEVFRGELAAVVKPDVLHAPKPRRRAHSVHFRLFAVSVATAAAAAAASEQTTEETALLLLL